MEEIDIANQRENVTELDMLGYVSFVLNVAIVRPPL
jgi:hypothetical protein